MLLMHLFLCNFVNTVRASDKRIQCEEEFSDSEDEGEGGRRDNYSNKEGSRNRKRPRHTPVEKMVSNGTDGSSTQDPKPAATTPPPVAANGAATNSEKPTKPSSRSSSPKEQSPKTEASNTADVSTEPSPAQEADRKRWELGHRCDVSLRHFELTRNAPYSAF